MFKACRTIFCKYIKDKKSENTVHKITWTVTLSFTKCCQLQNSFNLLSVVVLRADGVINYHAWGQHIDRVLKCTTPPFDSKVNSLSASVKRHLKTTKKRTCALGYKQNYFPFPRPLCSILTSNPQWSFVLEVKTELN